jgi:hypothetical protein
MAVNENLTRYDLVKAVTGWSLKSGGTVYKSFATKELALSGGLRRVLSRTGGTVRIYTKVGGIEEERTYPRSKDPRKSRG